MFAFGRQGCERGTKFHPLSSAKFNPKSHSTSCQIPFSFPVLKVLVPFPVAISSRIYSIPFPLCHTKANHSSHFITSGLCCGSNTISIHECPCYCHSYTSPNTITDQVVPILSQYWQPQYCHSTGSPNTVTVLAASVLFMSQ